MKTTLVILFNHPFPANLPKLRAIYGQRFPDIVFVMPLVKVDDPDVVLSYRGSYDFHGLVVDALPTLRARDSDAFVFIQDDLLLNPELNASNIAEKLQLDRYDGAITNVETFWSDTSDWSWNSRVASRLLMSMDIVYGSGVERWERLLPPAEAAAEKLAKYGVEQLRPTNRQPWRNPLGQLKYRVRVALGRTRAEEIPYPLASGFSDFFAIRRDALDTAGHLLGIFAAMNLFVETAIPTALVLGCDKLACVERNGWRCDIDWTDRKTLLAQRAKLTDIYARFAPDMLYIHPVKLSAVDMPDGTAA